jgi:hypothetical protein
LLIAIARTSPSSAEPQLSDPPGLCSHARKAYTAKVGERKEVGGRLGKEDEGATASREIRPDGSMEASKTVEEGSQIQPETDPSGGREGQTEVKAQTGATRDATTNHLIYPTKHN